jgi:hypothetical protein
MVRTYFLLMFAGYIFWGPHSLGIENKLLKSKAEAELKDVNIPVDTSEPLATVRVELKPYVPKNSVAWGVDVGVGRHQLQGSPELEFFEMQDLSTSPEFEIYYLKLNRHRKIENVARLNSWFVAGDVGFGRTTPDVKTKSGFEIEDVRLQVLRARLQAGVEWGLGLSSLALVPQIGVGVLNATQVSSNTSARFSETQRIMTGALFLQWRMVENGLLRVGFEQSQFADSKLVQLNNNTWLIELGYRL